MQIVGWNTAQIMKFSIKNIFSKYDQIRRKLQIWSHLPKKSLMENLIFCAVKLMKLPAAYTLNIKTEVIKLQHYRLKKCSSETLSIFWKTAMWKIKNFWNEIAEKIFFFYFQWSVFFNFQKIWTPVFKFYFWLINLWRGNEHVLRIIWNFLLNGFFYKVNQRCFAETCLAD